MSEKNPLFFCLQFISKKPSLLRVTGKFFKKEGKIFSERKEYVNKLLWGEKFS